MKKFEFKITQVGDCNFKETVLFDVKIVINGEELDFTVNNLIKILTVNSEYIKLESNGNNIVVLTKPCSGEGLTVAKDIKKYFTFAYLNPIDKTKEDLVAYFSYVKEKLQEIEDYCFSISNCARTFKV